MAKKFDIAFLEEARQFLLLLDDKTRKKILINLEKAQTLNDPTLFKKLVHDIWEFRTHFNGLQYRLLAFWDKRDNNNTLVITTHGFIKKQDAVPKKEIEKARKAKDIYFQN